MSVCLYVGGVVPLLLGIVAALLELDDPLVAHLGRRQALVLVPLEGPVVKAPQLKAKSDQKKGDISKFGWARCPNGYLSVNWVRLRGSYGFLSRNRLGQTLAQTRKSESFDQESEKRSHTQKNPKLSEKAYRMAVVPFAVLFLSIQSLLLAFTV